MVFSIHHGVSSRSLFYVPSRFAKRTIIQLSDTALQQKLKPSFLFDPLNSVTSVSQINQILTKKQSFRETSKENHKLQGTSLTIKQYYKYSLMFLQFLKKGVQNVWLNKKALNLLVKEGKLGHESINELTKQICDTSKLAKYHESRTMSRSLYQTILRTRRDIVKLPIFGGLVLIFGEFTPLICYLFPFFTLSTCLLPQLFRRYYIGPERAEAKLRDFNSHRTIKEEKQALILLCEVLQLKSRLFPSFLISESVLREKLEARCREIVVDNFLISKNGGVWNLVDLEVLNACIQRGILNFSRFDNLKDTDEKSFYQQINFERLRLKLFESMTHIDHPDFDNFVKQIQVAEQVDQMTDSEVEELLDRVKSSAESSSLVDRLR